METLVLDGKSYVKASKAAKELGYATDYVGQLCRSGKVDAHLIGRTWYVNPNVLSEHKVEKKRTSKAKAREYAKKTIEEHRKKREAESQNIYKNIKIQYESDPTELLPKTRTLSVQRTPVHSAHDIVAPEEDTSHEIQNVGEKVMMSGDVPVIDVNDDAIDQETTVLTPGRIRRTPDPREVPMKSSRDSEEVSVAFNKQEKEEQNDESVTESEDYDQDDEEVDTEDESESESSEENDVDSASLPTFQERLEAKSAEVSEVSVAKTQKVQSFLPQRIQDPTEHTPSVLPYVIVCVLFLCIGVLSIFFSHTSTYQSEERNTYSRYEYNIQETISKIQLLIKK
jgi:hypothetical protein